MHIYRSTQWLQGWGLDTQHTHNQLHEATPMQAPKLIRVGGALLCNVVALGSWRDMVLDVVVFQLVDLMLAVCVR